MSRRRSPFSLFLVTAFISFAALASAQTQPSASAKAQYALPGETVLRVALNGPANPAGWHAGQVLDGSLAKPVFLYDQELLPVGSRIRVVVDDVKRQRIEPAKKTFMEKLETIRSFGLDRKYTYQIALRPARVALADGREVEMRLAFVQAGEALEVHAKGDEARLGETSASHLAKQAPGFEKIDTLAHGKERMRRLWHPTMTLKLVEPVMVEASRPAGAPAMESPQSGQAQLAAGARARLELLNALSATGSNRGDKFSAKLEEPVFTDGRMILPEGTLFEGEVRKVVHPRRLSRPGMLYIAFNKYTLPDGTSQQIAASLAAAAMDKTGAPKIDAEGGMHAPHRGAKETLKDFGIAFGAQQLADEAVELALHAAAPYASAATGLFFFLGGKGHDVVLPKYSEVEIVFDRAINVHAGQSATLGKQ